MLLAETAIFYLLLGGAVAVAVYIRGRATPGQTDRPANGRGLPVLAPVPPRAVGPIEQRRNRSDRGAMARPRRQRRTGRRHLSSRNRARRGARRPRRLGRKCLEQRTAASRRIAPCLEIAKPTASARSTACSPSPRPAPIRSPKSPPKSKAPARAKKPAAKHPPTFAAPQPHARRSRRHARLGPRAGHDDPPRQIQRTCGAAEELVAQIAAAVQGLSEVSSSRKKRDREATAPSERANVGPRS